MSVNNGFITAGTGTSSGIMRRDSSQFTSYVITNSYNYRALAEKIVTPGLFDTLGNLFTALDGYFNRILMFPCYIPPVLSSGGPGLTKNFTVTGWLGVPTTINEARCDTPQFPYSFDGSEAFHTLFDDIIPTKYGDFRDYGDRTLVKIFLPYLGFVTVPANDVVGKYLKVYLGIDFASGTGIYYLATGEAVGVNVTGFRIISKHSVKLALEIPIGSTNNYNVQRDLILSGVAIAGVAAAGAASLGGSVSTTTSVVGAHTVTTATNTQSRAPVKGSRLKTTYASTETVSRPEVTKTSTTETHPGSGSVVKAVGDASLAALGSAVSTANSMHTNSPALEQFGSKYVVIVIERPKYPAMGDYAKLSGKPLCAVRQLSTVHGYTEIGDIHLEGFAGATSSERDALHSVLTSGIILP